MSMCDCNQGRLPCACKGEPVQAGEALNSGELSALRICAKLGHSTTPEVLLRLLDMVEPVPPAGDVECAICVSLGDQCVTCEEQEFKAWAEKHFASPDYSQTSAGVYIKDWMRHSFAAWQARSKDVIRLTAERDGLLAEVERKQGELSGAQAMLETAYSERDQLKDRFDKLNLCCSIEKNLRQEAQSELTKARELLAATAGFSGPTMDELEQARLYLSQSAPAAKGGE